MRRKENHITQRLVFAVLASMVSMSIAAQMPAKRPQLVVGIVVDGLQEDYINLLKGYFGDGGFNRLMRDGVVLENVDYGTPLDLSAATAMLYTGAAPSVNGIPSTMVYDRNTQQQRHILLDPATIGNYTDETYSPTALTASTLSDEMRIDTDGLGYVYSISADATQSIIMAGHAGNSAFWINDITGKWATTTYYTDLPSTMRSRNASMPLSARLDTIAWEPAMKINDYPDLPEHKRAYPFRHIFSRSDKNRYRAYKISAPANSEITDVATQYIKTIALGQRGQMDMLNIAYTVSPYIYTKQSDSRVEQMDSYLRLDRDLQRLFAVIDQKVGLNNTLIFIAGTPARTRTRRDDEKWRIPYGEFSTRRAASLLNMYLMAIHGNGEWVSGFQDNQIYLNHKLIDERDKSLSQLRAEAAEFMLRMSGVSSAYTIDEIISGRGNEKSERLRQNISISTAGDIFVSVNPGWSITNATDENTQNTVTRAALPTAPVYILAPGVQAQRITINIDARTIAPTVARLLRIRSPNAAECAPLRF